MRNIFEKFNDKVDMKGLKKDIDGAKENSSGDFKEVPHGKYEVCIEKMEMVMTKKLPERPMLSVWFKILEGEFEGQRLFMNQLLTNGFPIHLASEFLTRLDSDVAVNFEDYGQFYDVILEVMSQIEGKKEYGLTYEDNKGFDKFTVEQVFDVE